MDDASAARLTPAPASEGDTPPAADRRPLSDEPDEPAARGEPAGPDAPEARGEPAGPDAPEARGEPAGPDAPEARGESGDVAVPPGSVASPATPASDEAIASDEVSESGAIAGQSVGRLAALPGVVAPWAVVAVAVLLPVVSLWGAPGPPMEEGFMLVFPELVLEGGVPNRDFLHLYGPGSLWSLAGVFQVFGTTLATERAVGLLQLFGIAFGVFAVLRPWGRWVAAAGGALAAVIVVPTIGLTALAWTGGLALSLWALNHALGAANTADTVAADTAATDTAVAPNAPNTAILAGAGATAVSAGDASGDAVGIADVSDAAAAADAVGHTDDGAGADAPVPGPMVRRRRRGFVIAGLLAGAALLFRPDLVVAIGLAALVVWRGLTRPDRRRLLAGFAVGVSPYLIHLATAGVGNAVRGLVIEPVFDLRAGRSLPFPPSFDEFDGFLQRAGQLIEPAWPLPAPPTPAQLSLWVGLLLAANVALVVTGVWAARRGDRRLLALALFSVGLLPQAIQRADSTHLAWVSCVPLGLLPAAVAEVQRAWRPRWRPSQGALLAGAVPVVATLVLAPHFVWGTYTDHVGRSLGVSDLEQGTIRRGDREFHYGRLDAVAAVNAMLPDVERISEPGDSLFVGTGDLRKTPYSEAFLYYLLPELEPATHYIEMDPGVANAPDSGLADELRDADVVILSSIRDDWDEPNDSRVFGPNEPNQVIDEEFCPVGSYGEGLGGHGLYELYQPCPTT